MTERSDLRLDSVQCLRAAAATSVMLHHIVQEMEVIAGVRGVNFSIQSVMPFDAGVDCFFLISGFIMAVSCDTRFGRPDAAREFMLRRLARIIPLYWATTALFVGLMILIPVLSQRVRPSVAQFVLSLLFVPQPDGSGNFHPVYPLGWTLNYEMLFYALFALALLFRRAVGYCVLTGALLGLVGMAALDRAPGPLQFWGNPIVLEFLAGAGLGYAYCRGFAVSKATQVGLVCTGIIALFSLRLVSASLDVPRLAGYALPCALMLGGLVLRDPDDASPLPRWLIELGDASYSLYLVHLFVLRASHKLIGNFTSLPLAFDLGLYAVLSFVGSIIAALIVHARFERPITAFAHEQLRKVFQDGRTAFSLKRD